MELPRYARPVVRLPDLSNERRVTLTSSRVILGTLGAYGFSVVIMALTYALPVPSVLTVPFIVLSLSFVPGSLLVVAVGRENLTVTAETILYAFGSSLLILMAVGTLANILLPLVGVVRPLMPIPLGSSVTVAVALLAVVAYVRHPSGEISIRIPPLWAPAPLALLLLPLLSIIGVSLVNTTGVNVLLVIALLAVGLIPLVAIRWLAARWYPLAVWTMALAVLYHKSLWQYAGFGGRPHGIEAWELGRWSPGVVSVDPYSSELVQNGVLFPMYARLSNLFIMTQYEVVNPFFVSFIPLALYVAFRRYVSADGALLGAAVFVFVHPFYLQYPTAGRAATPVLFLALFGVVLSNEGLSSGSRAALAVSFLIGVVVSHYGTSYYVAAAFVIALFFLYTLWLLDDLVNKRGRSVAPVTDGGASLIDSKLTTRSSSIFSLTTVFFFLSSALGWYFYTRGGWKFDLLPKHVHQNLMTLISGPTVGGRTSARVQETYASTSIEVAKYLYILLAILALLGLAVIYYRRVVRRTHVFNDEYLTIATALFAIFGITLILRNWGGGRPMMITFSFTTVFAVIGAVWFLSRSENGVLGVLRYLPWPLDVAGKLERRLPSEPPLGAYAFASLLLVLFILNTGVAAATVFGGLAPSNVPAQSILAEDDNPESQVIVHRETDISTHVWMVQHLDDGHGIYGDTYSARQFDWYRPDIAARTPAPGGGYTAKTKPGVLNVERQRTGTQTGYTLIMGHNLVLDAVWTSRTGPGVPLEALSLDQQNRIYTTGESAIYFDSEAERSSS